jgi:hypothetical protein
MNQYEKKPLGFDRTQLFKEYTQPIVERQAALKTTMTLMETHNLKWSMSDILLVSKRLIQWMETGDESWVKKMDEYFQLNRDQQLEELFSDHLKKKIEIL